MSDKLKAFLVGFIGLLIIAIIVLAGGGGSGISKQVSFSIQVNVAGDFTIAITPDTVTCTKGEVLTFAILAVASGGFDAPIQLSVAGLPVGSYEFSRNPLEAGAMTSQLTVRTADLQSNTSYACMLEAHDQ